MRQQKLLLDFTFDPWLGVLVPKTTPDTAVAKVNTTMNEVIQLLAVSKGTQEIGNQTPRVMTVADLDTFYASEIEGYRCVFKSIKKDPR